MKLWKLWRRAFSIRKLRSARSSTPARSNTVDNRRVLVNVTGCDAVFMPTLSLDTLNQISDLDGDDTSGRIACEALSQGKTVWVPTDDTIGQGSSSEVRRKVNQKLQEAGEMGLITTPLPEMSHDFLEESGKSGELTEVTVCRGEPNPDEEPGMKVSRDEDQVSAVVQTEDVRIGHPSEFGT